MFIFFLKLHIYPLQWLIKVKSPEVFYSAGDLNRFAAGREFLNS